MEQITPTRKPLFGVEEKLEKKVAKPVASFAKQEFKPTSIKSGGESIFSNTKLLVSLGVIFIAVVTIVVVLMVGGNYGNDVAEKSSLLLPLFFGKDIFK
tara:strand:+ start:578 stop:874 length:297 start_codon:yes stop_codon:yes gene_type:complete